MTRHMLRLAWLFVSVGLDALLGYQWYFGPMGARTLFLGWALIALITGLVWRSWWSILAAWAAVFIGGRISGALWRRACPTCGENDADIIGIVGTYATVYGFVALNVAAGTFIGRWLFRTFMRDREGAT